MNEKQYIMGELVNLAGDYVTDYPSIKGVPITQTNLPIQNPTPNTYYQHTGLTTGTYTENAIYFYDGETYKIINGSGSGSSTVELELIENNIYKLKL